MLDLYYIPVYMQTNLYTDDSFKFNEVLKELNQVLQTLPEYSDVYDKQKTSFSAFYDKLSEESATK